MGEHKDMVKVNFIVEIGKDNKHACIPVQVSEYTNLYHYFDCYFVGRNIEVVAVNYSPSKKQAWATCDSMNDYFKRHDMLLECW